MLEIAKKTSCKIEFATSPQIIKKLERLYNVTIINNNEKISEELL